MSRDTMDAVVLAGDRRAGDPLAQRAGKPGKALVEIAGTSMLVRVLRAVAGVRGMQRIVPVCPGADAYLEELGPELSALRIEPRDGPAASVTAALEWLGPIRPVVVVTADHPLLRPRWVDEFAARARASGADAVVGVVDYRRVIGRFPGHRRTRYRFADGAVCGTNLFWFSGQRGLAATGVWRDFEAHRKTPWKMIGRLGIMNLARYALGRMTLDEAARALTRRLGVGVAIVHVDDPAAAVDVDSPADLELVGELISARETTSA